MMINDQATDQLTGLLHQTFGFDSLREGQRQIVTAVMACRDTLAVLPTGGGKSLCYQLPAIARKGITVVVSPLISLMDDQVGALQEKGIAAGAIHSGHSLDNKRDTFKELRDNDHFLLYISPERIQTEGFLRWFQTQDIGLIAVDEAHCISQWGHDFRPDYQQLGRLRALRPEIPILALTATATPTVLDDIARQLNLQDPDRHVYGFYRPNLYYQVELCENDAEKMYFVEAAIRQFPEGRIIIYCGTRKLTQQLSAALSRVFTGVGYYNGGLNNETRERIQKQYDAGEIRILAATNAFGMGIDHPDVRLVIHYQVPGNIESLYQEMGRAGRDGNDSTCLLLYAKKDKGLHAFFINSSDAPADIKKKRWNALETLVQYAEGGECRHSGILTYFRDAQRIDACGHCDCCDLQSGRRVRVESSMQKTARPEPKIPGKKKRVARARKVTLNVEAGKALDGDALERHRALKAWRKEYAQANDMPAFVIFSNRTLRELSVQNPQSSADLWEIHGLGEQKIEMFGDDILKILKRVPISCK